MLLYIMISMLMLGNFNFSDNLGIIYKSLLKNLKRIKVTDPGRPSPGFSKRRLLQPANGV